MTDFTLSGLPRDVPVSIEIRAVNAVGPGPASDTKTATPTGGAALPDAFGPADWELADAGTGGTLRITVLALPADNNAALETIEASRDGGPWELLGAAATGTFRLQELPDGQAVALRLRATNRIGAGPASDAKTATPTASAVTDPDVVSIAGDGWQAVHASPPAEFAPETDPRHVVVSRAGHDGGGAASVFEEVVTLTKRVRRPWPDHATLTADRAALSEFVYAGDTIPGVANDSTRGAPKPLALWLRPDMDETDDAGLYTARLAVAHAHARDGRPVAAVRFRASDGTATVETVVSAMSAITYGASGLTVPHFAAQLDLSGLAAGPVTLDAVIYPWVGAAFTISADADPYPSPNLTTLRLLNRPAAWGRAYAHVDPATGDDGAGAASEDPAAAAAAPFASVPAAAAAVRAYNAAAFGRDEGSGGVVRLAEGTHDHGAFASVPTGALPITIEAAGDRAATIYRDPGASASNGLPGLVRIRGVTLQRNAADNVIFLDSGAAGAANALVLEDCVFDEAGLGPSWGAIVYRVGRLYLVNCGGDRFGHAVYFSATAAKMIVAVGCAGASIGRPTYHAAGCRDLEAEYVWRAGLGANVPAEGGFLGWCHIANRAAGRKLVLVDDEIPERGFALVGSVLEQYGDDTAPALFLSADGSSAPVRNLVRIGTTVVGARTNQMYQDSGTATIVKDGVERFNVDAFRNTKTDVFGEHGALTGNWAVVHRVSARANAAVRGDNRQDAYGPGHWLGEVPALGEVFGTDAAPLATAWADDRSFAGTATGGGDYTPGPGHALPAIPAGLAPWSHDLAGRPVPNDGTGVAGALQRA